MVRYKMAANSLATGFIPWLERITPGDAILDGPRASDGTADRRRRPRPRRGMDELRPHGDIWGWNNDEAIDLGELHRRIAGVDAVLTLLTTKVDAAFLDAAGPQLQSGGQRRRRLQQHRRRRVRRRGVPPTNTPGVLTEATADIAMSLILMVTRRLGEGERIVRSGQPWQWGMFMLLGTRIQGRRLGIVGMGEIGEALARRARASACGRLLQPQPVDRLSKPS